MSAYNGDVLYEMWYYDCKSTEKNTGTS
jgi:hypothetical protein